MKKKQYNFLPKQYDQTDQFPINHNYLSQQFSDYNVILEKVSKVVQKGDFTLGNAVSYFEDRFSDIVGTNHAIGVGSGTDALFLSLKALGIGEGDEVITTAFTFYATIGAIVTAGAKPVFVDVKDDFNIDPKKISKVISSKTKAIMPVHWTGTPCDMDQILDISRKYNLHIIEDACHAITSSFKNKNAGSFGISGCFSMHPLKNLNVWGDGGVICTNDEKFANKIRLLRNHGLVDRDTCEIFGYNSRLDTIQAVIADHLLDKLNVITNARIENANYLDNNLKNIKEIYIPNRNNKDTRQVYHIYSLLFERRDELKLYLNSKGIDAKIHYPNPIHLQPAAKAYGYKKGDFPMAEKISSKTLSLPVHEFVKRHDLDTIIDEIMNFYS